MVLGGYTYIMTTKNNTVLYTGSTEDLVSRTLQHKFREFPKAFTARYNCEKLVYWKAFPSIEEARDYEYYLKGKKRSFKISLIEKVNPKWNDLWSEIRNW